MKRLAILSIIFIATDVLAFAQKKTPEEKSIVNKEYDEHGNLIQYDSTYVWQWNSDSTLNFQFDDKFAFGKNFPGIFGEFFNDSIFGGFGLKNDPFFQPFSEKDFFGHFKHPFPGFPFEQDSTFNFGFETPDLFNYKFNEPELWQKWFEEQFGRQHSMIPQFMTPQQQEEWEKLMKKQQKEKEELLKKWEKQQPKKVY